MLTTSSFGQQATGSHNENPVATELEQSLTEHHRNVRVPSSAGQLKPIQRVDGNVDQKANIGALLAKYLQQARKGNSQLIMPCVCVKRIPFEIQYFYRFIDF